MRAGAAHRRPRQAPGAPAQARPTLACREKGTLIFTDYPTFPLYRTVKDVTPDLPPISGEDVYAVQKAMNHVLPAEIVPDGVAGSLTGESIWHVQRKLGIVEDGLAGQETQRALAIKLLAERLRPWTTRYLLCLGIILKESSGWLGIYSEQRENGSYDAGVVQMNTEHRDPQIAFDPVRAIPILVAETVEALKQFQDREKFVGSDHSRRRRLSLAAGNWNAPAYAHWLAGVKPNAEPGLTAKATLEEYMRQATRLLD